MAVTVAVAVELESEGFPLLAQLGGAQDIGLPEVMLAGPLEETADVRRVAPILLAHQPQGVGPGRQVALLAAARQGIHDVGHPLGQLDVDRLTPLAPLRFRCSDALFRRKRGCSTGPGRVAL